MDKLKEQLAVVKEHSFWIMCGGILLVSLVSWYMSTSHLQNEQKKYKAEIDSAQSTLKGVSGTPDHPNDSTNKGMAALTQAYGEDVYRGWAKLAENQVQVLVWEGDFADEEFKKEVRSLWPIETTKGEITPDSRTLYREYILDVLPALADTVRSKWVIDAKTVGSGSPGMGGAGGPGMMSGPPGLEGDGASAGAPGMPGIMGGGASVAKNEDPSVVVSWDSANQRDITQVHFGLATSEAIPSTLQVLYAQEDLWVFQNLMKIIRDTNGDATRRHEAAIKSIEYVRIGRSAGDVAGEVTGMKGGSSAAGTGGGGMDAAAAMGGGAGGPGMGGAGGPEMGGAGMGGAGMGGAGTPGMPSGAGGPGMASGGATPGMPGGSPGMPGMGGTTGGGASSSTLGSGRYVDRDYASITDISRLRSAMNGTPTKPEDMLLAVAKRMPVRMQFKMDQRKLTLLLAHCGNSKLPVEVRQVRINRPSSSLGGGGGGGMAGMMGMAGGAGMAPPGGDDGAASGPAGMGAGMMSGMGGGGGMAGMMQGRGGAGGARATSGIASSREDPNEITVEIYGIVYIYNPPDRKLLGIPEPAGTTPGTIPPEKITPPTTPASTTPATPTPPLTAGATTGG